ncbi:hypothetical protein D3C84_467090 [compost metagenome]
MQVVLTGIQLAHYLADAIHIGRRIGHHQRIGRHRRADIAIGRHQRPHQPGNVRSAAGVQFDDTGHKLRSRGGLFRTLTGSRPGLGNRRDEDPVALVDHRKVVGIEHRIEQPAHPFAVQGLAGHDRDAAGDSRVQHHGGSQNVGDLFDNVAQFGIVHRQLPFFFLGLKGAVEQRRHQDARQEHGTQGSRTHKAVHQCHHSDCPENGRRKCVGTAGDGGVEDDASRCKRRVPGDASINSSSRPLFHSTT